MVKLKRNLIGYLPLSTNILIKYASCLDRQEDEVEDPTEWCTGLVVVRKKSGQVRICVDLKQLNLSVLRETHPIPGVES